MTLFADLGDIVRENVPLAGQTWFGLGGPARWLLQPTDEAQLATIVRRCRDADVPLRVLGSGSNLLVRDEGFDGAVVRLSAGRFAEQGIDETCATAGAGVDMGDFVRAAIRQGLAGLECMAGIPGTVGGALRGNAGGRFGEIGDRAVGVRVMDHRGEVRELGQDEVRFEYRWSSLRDWIVVAGRFELDPNDPDGALRRYKEIWAYKESVQPFVRGSAGCIFKNPSGQSAGQLIDEAGLKGRTIGGATISDRHANFIVVRPGAKAADVIALAELARERVSASAGVDLAYEIEIW